MPNKAICCERSVANKDIRDLSDLGLKLVLRYVIESRSRYTVKIDSGHVSPNLG